MTADNTNWAEWCARHYDAKACELVLYGRALGLSHAEAEDVLQETFQALLALTRAPQQPEFYCLRAYRNRVANCKRGFLRRVLRELEAVHWFEATTQTGELAELAEKTLKKLPPEQAEVIVLKIWHGHTFEEISELTGSSPNTVAGRYRYGLEKLRNWISHEQRMEYSGGAFEVAPAERALN